MDDLLNAYLKTTFHVSFLAFSDCSEQCSDKKVEEMSVGLQVFWSAEVPR